jgi:hypothetical protein
MRILYTICEEMLYIWETTWLVERGMVVLLLTSKDCGQTVVQCQMKQLVFMWCSNSFEGHTNSSEEAHNTVLWNHIWGLLGCDIK